MQAIRAELAANRVALHAHATRMFDMAAHMRDSPENKNQASRPCYGWDQWRGIGGLNLVDAAYQTSIATQALANMPFAEAQLISQIYGWQRYLQKGFDLSGGLLMGQPQALEFCVGVIEEVGRGDQQLETEYVRLIDADAAAPAVPATTH